MKPKDWAEGEPSSSTRLFPLLPLFAFSLLLLLLLFLLLLLLGFGRRWRFRRLLFGLLARRFGRRLSNFLFFLFLLLGRAARARCAGFILVIIIVLAIVTRGGNLVSDLARRLLDRARLSVVSHWCNGTLTAVEVLSFDPGSFVESSVGPSVGLWAS